MLNGLEFSCTIECVPLEERKRISNSTKTATSRGYFMLRKKRYNG